MQATPCARSNEAWRSVSSRVVLDDESTVCLSESTKFCVRKILTLLLGCLIKDNLPFW